MPTPLVHLYVSQKMLESGNDQIVAPLHRHAGDFMLGSIAPDAWSLGDLSRTDAHLLPIPVPQDAFGAAELLYRYPVLRDAGALKPAQAAFVAGYMTHLLLDEIWYHDLFNPYFLNGDNELPVQHRLVLHNVLRLAVEDDLEPQVSPASIQSFSSLPISYALPPIDDATLAEWRDLIRSEFSPGGEKRSADVFAERLRVPVEELTMILHSPARMQDEVFSRLPAGRSERVIDDGIRLGIDLLAVYLNGHAREEMPTTVANMLRKSRHV